MDPDELNGVKTRIQSTLVAGGTAGYRVSEFEQLYKEDWYAGIPYQQFGFSSVADFLKSIPDTVHVSVGLNGVATVSVVKEDRMASLIRMVDRTEPEKKAAKTKPPAKVGMVQPMSTIPGDLSVDLLMELIRDSKQISINDLKMKAKKRKNVDITLEKLNKLFKCSAGCEREAYQIGLRGAVKITPTGGRDGIIAYIGPISLTPSSSSSSLAPTELTYDLLLELIKESKTIQIADLKHKALKRYKVAITLDLLNKLFNCQAPSELEAYTIGLKKVVEVKPTKNGNGTLTVIRNNAPNFTKESILNEVRRRKTLTLGDLHRHYQNTYNTLFSTEVANRILGTNELSPLAAITAAFGNVLNIEQPKDGGSEWNCKISAKKYLTYQKKATYTMQTLIDNINRFDNLFLNGHERFAVEHYDVPDLGLETLNRILGTSASTKRQALQEALPKEYQIAGSESNIVIKKVASGSPVDKSNKRDRFIELLKREAPIYASSLWKEFSKEFKEEATLAVLNKILDLAVDNKKDALKSLGNVRFEEDLVLDTFLIFYPADVQPRATNDFLRYQFVALVKASNTISLFNLCVKLKKQFQADFNLQTMNKVFGCREPTRKAIIERCLSSAISLAGRDDNEADKGLRLQLTYIGKDTLVGLSNGTAECAPSTSSAGSTAPSPVPPPPVKQKAPAPAPPAAKPAPVATVAPLSRLVTADVSCQTNFEPSRPMPTNLAHLADELAAFLKTAGGIKLMVSDVTRLLKSRYSHFPSTVFPDTYQESMMFSEKLVHASSAKLNLIYVNEVAFVQLFDRSSEWNPSVAKHVKVPLVTNNVKLMVSQPKNVNQPSRPAVPERSSSTKKDDKNCVIS